jgi:hypothetical protein
MGERSVLDLVLRSKKTGSGGKEAEAELRGFERAAKSAASAAKSLAIGGGAVVAAIAGAVKIVDAAIGPFVDYGRTVRELGGALGLSAQETSRLIQVGDDFKISVDEMRIAMEMATKKGFVPSVENLAQLADKLEGIDSPTERAAELTKIFGRNWTVLLPMLSAGGDAIRENAAAISESLILTEESVQMTRDWEIALDQWQDRIEAAKISSGSFMVEGLLPWFDIAEQMPAVTDVMSDRLREFDQRARGAGIGGHEGADGVAALDAKLAEAKEALEAGVAVDGWLEALHGVKEGAQDAAAAQMALVQSFSEVTAASLATTALEELNAAKEAGLITDDQYEAGLRDIGGAFLGLTNAQIEAMVQQSRFKSQTSSTTAEVWKEIAALKALNEQLQRWGNLSGRSREPGEKSPRAKGQHGLNMTVPPGFERDNFLIGVSSREHVQVTPPGRTPPGASIGQIGPIILQVPQGANGRQIVDEMMAEISRRVRVASGSGAAFVGG